MKNLVISALAAVVFGAAAAASGQTQPAPAAPGPAVTPPRDAAVPLPVAPAAVPPTVAPVAVPPPAAPAAVPPPAPPTAGAIQGAQPLSSPALAPITPAADAGAATTTDDYVVNPGDVLEVQVVGLDTVPRKARVDATGIITLPLIGTVQVAGKAPRQIEGMVADALRVKYMQDPQVTVFVAESVSQRFSIEGAVRTPNLFPLKGRMTLLQALAMSGGPTKVADLTQVRIFRGNGATKQNLLFDAEKIRDGSLADPPIFGNDVIIVEASGAKTAFYETLDTIRGMVSFGTVR